MDIYDFIWEEPSIPLDFSDEEILKCRELTKKIVIREMPALEFENYRLGLTIVEKGMVVSQLSVVFNKVVKEVRKSKQNDNQQ